MPTISEQLAARVDAKASEVAMIAGSMRGVTVDRKERLVRGTVATNGLAMDNMVWLVHQFDFSYFPGAVRAVYLNHNYHELPVGTCRNMAAQDDGSVFSTTHITERAIGDELLTCIEEGALRGKSMGIRIVDSGPATAQEIEKFPQCRACACVVRGAKVLEYSLTAMPADPQALMDLVSRGLIRRPSAVSFGLPDTPIRRLYPVDGPAKVSRLTPA